MQPACKWKAKPRQNAATQHDVMPGLPETSSDSTLIEKMAVAADLIVEDDVEMLSKIIALAQDHIALFEKFDMVRNCTPPRPQFRTRRQWPSREENRDSDSKWVKKKYRRVFLNNLQSGRPEGWVPAAIKRHTACGDCKLNDYAMFCQFHTCAKCCVVRYGGCGRGTHIRES